MSKYNVTVGSGSDTVVVELGQPSDPILVDGKEIGLQCADGSCRTEQCIRIALGRMYGPVYETEDAARADGRKPGVDEIVIWDDVAYDEVG